ncbi:hypothetical protein, partial [Tenacibaculum maritimum]|uniref:hypothetical protein n=1 Tax=Tenacibaculum maritimum TaxID=107401 RepID=UPI001F4355D4
DLKCRRQASSLSKCAVKLKIFMVIFYSKIRLFIQLWMITDIQIKIQKIINSIDLKKIKEFTTTSKKRFSDRALQATISITINDITYNALPFDEEHPPKELTPLILLLKGFIK